MNLSKSIYFYFFLLLLVGCKQPKAVQKPNVLLICVDDLRPELKSFGADYISSPNIDALSEQSVSFQKHYVNAPSCGPSRYTLLTGQYGLYDNYALFKRAKRIADGDSVAASMPEYFRTQGYTTVSVGKVSHHPGGRGGKDWNDDSIIEMPKAWDKHLMPVAEWQHPRGAMHGLANGEIRGNRKKNTAVIQAFDGDDNSYPDGAITDEALSQIKQLSTNKEKPFFLAVGLIKPHLPFGAPKKYFDRYADLKLPATPHPEKPNGKTTWHHSGEFNTYNLRDKDPNNDAEFADEIRRHYAACVSYADAHVGKILAELKASGAAENTIVVLWGDHGWHLGEHAIWGKHSLFEEALHSPLIIHYPGMTHKGISTQAMVASLDIFPTLCDLMGIETPAYAQGISLKAILDQPGLAGHATVAYNGKGATLRTDTHRMTLHKDGFVELYDHTSPEKETKNIADQAPDLVKNLKEELIRKLNL